MKPPLIGECITHLECKLIEPSYAKDDIIVGEVLAAWSNPGVFDKTWNLPSEKESFLIHAGGSDFLVAKKWGQTSTC